MKSSLETSVARTHSISDSHSQWSAQKLADSSLGQFLNGDQRLSSPVPAAGLGSQTAWELYSASMPDVASILEGMGQATTTSNTSLYPIPTSHPKGAWYKGRFLAQSHWINYAHKVCMVLSLLEDGWVCYMCMMF